MTVALAELWRSFGVQPVAVAGHSQGEIAAAHIAGGLSLEDAALLTARRSRIIARLAGEGAMVSLAAPAERAAELIEGLEGAAEVAALNGPSATIVSAASAAVAELLERCEREDVRAREVPATIPSHSALVEPLREEVLEALSGISPRSGEIPFHSTVTGEVLDTAELGPEYWYRNLRRAVRLEPVVRALLGAGVGALIEISPHPVLAVGLEETVEDAGEGREQAVALGSLRRGEGDLERFALSLAGAHAAGVGLDWEAVCGGRGNVVPLPTYPFQRKPYWLAPRLGEGATGESHGVAVAPARTAEDGVLAQRLAELADEDERRALVLDLVRTETATALGYDSAAAVEPQHSFKDLGIESAVGVEMRNRLVEASGLRLGAAVVFDHPSPQELARHMYERASGSGAAVVARRTIGSEEPIAIVGMSCRYPGGADSPQRLWQLVAEGRDAITEFPADRGWDLERLYDPDPERSGTSYTRHGGFLADPGDFDAAFFGISPREALASDPQQRLLLEACWEAVEAAGIDPGALHGTQTGVFAGIGASDYAAGMDGTDDELDGYRLLGISSSVVSGRVAYTLGLEGPAISVDTACSSSLVSAHLASQALRSGECTMALAGGVAVLSSPFGFVEFSRQRGLAADGRCKSFAEAADGISWSEGVGVLVLERLSDAERAGRRVLATIRGSAINQDGASNGLSAPRGPAQEQVIRQALANAGLRAADVDAVEAHGTGTTLGDPIEAEALLATYGQERERPLKLGSIKSNIGHAQAAAGVAGVIKTVMALREGVLPKTLHVDAPSSHIDWEAGAVELLTESVEWQAEDRPRRAGVSSFGVSGTNAHLILEQAPVSVDTGDGKTTEPSAPALGGELPFVLSAKQPEALRELAQRLTARLDGDPELELGDLAYSLATTRADLSRRAVLVAAERGELLAGLGALAADEEAPNLVLGTARLDRRPAFLFPGQGSQWQGMAIELAAASAPFAAALDACEQALEPFVEWSLRDVLSEAEGAWLDRLDIVQPALFAVMVSLARLWRACGVEPAVVLGHSQGEIAAAHVAGGLGLEDAARVVALRARAMAKIAGKGAMASVSVPEGELEPILAPFGERVSLAAVNGPASLVLSGEVEAIEELIAGCEGNGVRAQRIAVDYAAHSAQIEALREELLEAFAPISPVTGEVPFHSTLTGERIDTAELGPEYWYRNLREPVRLEPVVRALIEAGTQTFVEVGPHPVLGFAVQETIDAGARPGEVAAIGTLRREDAGLRRFALSLAEAHAAGARPDWDAFFAATGAAAVPLPTYPFQRRRYWLSPSLASSDPSAVGQAASEHPLLGARIEDARGEGLTLTGRISLQTHPWLADHRVGGTILLPGTAFVELALRAGAEAGCERLAELALQAPLAVPESGGVSLQVLLGAAAEGGEREVSIHSRAEADEDGEEAPWTCHAEGLLAAEAGELGEPLGTWPPPGAEPVDGVAEAYDRLAELGFEYGPAFQGLNAAWRLGEDLYVEVSLDQEQAAEAERFEIHPALFDSVLHGGFFHDGFFAAMGGKDIGETGGLILPFAWTGVRLGARGATSLRVRLGAAEGAVTLHAFDPSGAPVLAVEALVGRAVSAELLPAAKPRPGGEGLLGLDWAEVEANPPAEAQPAELVALADLLPEPPAGAAAAARAATRAVLELAKERIADPAAPRLVLLSEGALAVLDGEGADPAGAAVWGLLRSAQSEHPGRFALIDSDGSEASRGALEQAVALSAAEPQLALREGAILAPRLSASLSRTGTVTPPAGPWSLVAAELGTLDGLAAVSLPRRRGSLGARCGADRDARRRAQLPRRDDRAGNRPGGRRRRHRRRGRGSRGRGRRRGRGTGRGRPRRRPDPRRLQLAGRRRRPPARQGPRRLELRAGGGGADGLRHRLVRPARAGRPEAASSGS